MSRSCLQVSIVLHTNAHFVARPSQHALSLQLLLPEDVAIFFCSHLANNRCHDLLRGPVSSLSFVGTALLSSVMGCVLRSIQVHRGVAEGYTSAAGQHHAVTRAGAGAFLAHRRPVGRSPGPHLDRGLWLPALGRHDGRHWAVYHLGAGAGPCLSSLLPWVASAWHAAPSTHNACCTHMQALKAFTGSTEVAWFDRHLICMAAQAMSFSAWNGLGLALVIPCVQSLIADVYSSATRGRAFGLLFLTSGLGAQQHKHCMPALPPDMRVTTTSQAAYLCMHHAQGAWRALSLRPALARSGLWESRAGGSPSSQWRASASSLACSQSSSPLTRARSAPCHTAPRGVELTCKKSCSNPCYGRGPG